MVVLNLRLDRNLLPLFQEKGITDIYTIPIGEPHWKAENRAKVPGHHDTQVLGSSPVPETPKDLQSAALYQLHTASSPVGLTLTSPSPVQLLESETHITPFPSMADIRSSSPIYIDDDRLSIPEFCAQYKLPNIAIGFLENLQFTPGDNLKYVTEKDVIDAGFKPLLWKRVLQSNSHYRRSLGM